MAFVAVAPTSLRSTAFLATPVSARPACRHRPALPVAAAPSRVVVGMAADGIKRVLVSGATGRTGKLAMAKLAKHADQLQAVGLVRSAEKAATVFGDGVETVVGDVTDRDQVFSIVRNNRIDALIVLSSAIPKFKPAEPGQRREHYFDDGQEPESVDWEGAATWSTLPRTRASAMWCLSAPWEHGHAPPTQRVWQHAQVEAQGRTVFARLGRPVHGCQPGGPAGCRRRPAGAHCRQQR
eukprot:TRINITY_DN1590_c0_g1_i5.p1 TRINITY_DN1590_c0_g1~~TRINITY_DN1590_c0_g1_i5.p1  ORF type:complete len:238 (-),score=53.74 TRINITY_DN1590_c0_g1_i5:436-1149(-)